MEIHSLGWIVLVKLKTGTTPPVVMVGWDPVVLVTVTVKEKANTPSKQAGIGMLLPRQVPEIVVDSDCPCGCLRAWTVRNTSRVV
jgi:hypothetical protein